MVLQKGNNGTRVAAGLLGVALMECASYVDSHFNADAYTASCKLAGDAVELGKLKWSKETKALVTSGKHGALVRFGKVDESGEWLKYKGSDGIERIISRAIMQSGIAVLSMAELVETCAKVGDIRTVAQRNADTESGIDAGALFSGFVYGSIGASYASLVFAHGGKVCIKDVECKANEYNSKVLVSLGDAATAIKRGEELKARLLKAAGLGEGAEVKDKGEAKVRKVKAK